MKPGIHPVYKMTRVVCVCGNVIETRSTFEKDEMHVEICAACHPFYTGKQKLLDKAGRIERFRRRYTPKGEKSEKSEKDETTTANQ